MQWALLAKRWPWLLPLGGITLAGGCLARFQNNLDILLRPEATSNLLQFGSSAVAPLAEFLARIFRG